MDCKGTRKSSSLTATSSSKYSDSDPVRDPSQSLSLQPPGVRSPPILMSSTWPGYGYSDEASRALSYSPSISSHIHEDSPGDPITSTTFPGMIQASHLNPLSGETSSYTDCADLLMHSYLHEGIDSNTAFFNEREHRVASPQLSAGQSISARELTRPVYMAQPEGLTIDSTETTSNCFDWDSFLADMDGRDAFI